LFKSFLQGQKIPAEQFFHIRDIGLAAGHITLGQRGQVNNFRG
jgi:hypothetical protein